MRSRSSPPRLPTTRRRRNPASSLTQGPGHRGVHGARVRVLLHQGEAAERQGPPGGDGERLRHLEVRQEEARSGPHRHQVRPARARRSPCRQASSPTSGSRTACRARSARNSAVPEAAWRSTAPGFYLPVGQRGQGRPAAPRDHVDNAPTWWRVAPQLAGLGFRVTAFEHAGARPERRNRGPSHRERCPVDHRGGAAAWDDPDARHRPFLGRRRRARDDGPAFYARSASSSIQHPGADPTARSARVRFHQGITIRSRRWPCFAQRITACRGRARSPPPAMPRQAVIGFFTKSGDWISVRSSPKCGYPFSSWWPISPRRSSILKPPAT